MRPDDARDPSPTAGSVREVFGVALRLGLTSFGGPIAHLGYFRREYVDRRGWLDEGTFADLIALCSMLPGPASSQLGMLIGTRRAGVGGGIAAWLGFTLPSAIVMSLVGLVAQSADVSSAGWVNGLKLAAVAVVAQAVYLGAHADTGLATAGPGGRGLDGRPGADDATRPDRDHRRGGPHRVDPPARALPRSIPIEPIQTSRRVGVIRLSAFFVLIVALTLLRAIGTGQGLALFDVFYRSGSLVFGGGHVVMPLLHASIVDPGWVSNDQFLAGYGAAQAIPGPLFTFRPTSVRCRPCRRAGRSGRRSPPWRSSFPPCSSCSVSRRSGVPCARRRVSGGP